VANLCSTLADLIESNGCKRPTVTDRWRTDARLLLDRDARPLGEALQVMRWALTDEFWKSNILSMPKFRAKYDQLRLRMANASVPQRGNGVAARNAAVIERAKAR
jgi:hypothetical protein